MPLREKERERLRGYCHKGDREGEPLFVGREDLFELVASKPGSGREGGTELAQKCRW